ncbi:hypothetical protein [Caldimonas thermodepolymerans]|uniref:Uncharacterized protein n=1 Tax=Caldimonas thermodepolymerans TaxID=215580 RepID=A0AA46DD85_9BURK|nr:hypothetical protein [Caldimonas thermodepolymerans]TCP06568.1 hypothetical protein EV676_10651 [Caldimonas thermodepolymerans]UZG49375.1 hypothetical protein ONS87_07075 [Caldimonas thermodepolymerans]
MALAAAQAVGAIAERLKGQTPAGQRVYTSRAWPLGEADLPAWRIYAQDETLEPIARNWPPRMQHTVTVELQGVVRQVSELDDALNDLAAAALSAIYSARFPKLAVHASRITREMSQDGEAAIGVVTVELTVQFETQANQPETIL